MSFQALCSSSETVQCASVSVILIDFQPEF